MKITAAIRKPFNDGDALIIPIVTKDKETVFNGLDNLLDKELTVEIKRKYQKRSLDSNAYLWLLLGKMAEVLKSTKDEIYLQMLERYGQYDVIVVKPWAAERIMQEWRTARIIGDINVDGEAGTQILCFYGSHTYNQKEMGVLIDGVVSECKEIGIETLPPEELAAMNERWNV